MRRAAASPRRPVGVSPLFLEPLEDRLLLSGAGPQTVYPARIATSGEPEQALAASSSTAQPISHQAATTPADPASDATPGDDDTYRTPSGTPQASTGQNGPDIENVSSPYLAKETSPRATAYPVYKDAAPETDAEYASSGSSLPHPAVNSALLLLQLPQNKPVPVAVPTSEMDPRVASPAPAEAEKQAPVPVAAARSVQEPASGGTTPVVATPLPAGPEKPSEAARELARQPAPGFVDNSSQPIASPGPLLAGALSLDLPWLKRAADEVLARLESLGDDLAAPPGNSGKPELLIAVFVLSGVLEFARRRYKLQEAAGAADPGEASEPTWDPSPLLAVLPREEVR